MITGDHAVTAQAIGRDLGILDADGAGARVLTGVELDRMVEEELDGIAREVPVFARVTPEHKLRVVKALRRQGEVVAVTGDGVNDAPALKVADIGIAMGRDGTDVAREAADMVLADDNFVSIHAAVEEGRITFDNVRKSTFFLLSSNTAEVLTILAALALDWPLPLLVVQILWLNLVTDGLQSVALAFEPGSQGVLNRPPRSRHEGILSRVLWERLAISGVVMTIGTLALFRWELDNGASLAVAQTVALTTLVMYQTIQAGNARSEHRLLLRMSPFANPFLFLSALAALVVHIVALYLPPTQYLLDVEPISLASWARIIAVSCSILVAVELHKLIRSGANAAR
jgi:Ca2+-transporting ATPase